MNTLGVDGNRWPVVLLSGFLWMGLLRGEWAADTAAKTKTRPRIEVLTAELGLSREQVKLIEPLVNARTAALGKLRADTSLSPSLLKEAELQIRRTYGDQIRKRLSPTQRLLYVDLVAKEGGTPTRIVVLTKALSLRPKQVKLIEPLIGARTVELQLIRENPAFNAVAKREAIEVTMKRYGEKIRAELSETQKTAYAALIKWEAGQ
ncbi:MAG: hypothetical protein J6386_04790 [Candidatus Synoicihabitans palmerolidicus]|nr:hypothetical protein [Candidatus Synoicihabitans palmerolidicus]MCC5022148.1 hypothetical protein [Candidatus Synoicihabitans palmerolidicus]